MPHTLCDLHFEGFNLRWGGETQSWSVRAAWTKVIVVVKALLLTYLTIMQSMFYMAPYFRLSVRPGLDQYQPRGPDL